MALGATLLLPILKLLAGIIITVLVLARGVRAATTIAALAGGTLILVAFVLSSQHVLVTELVVATCLPALLLAWIAVTTRSLTLTMQVSVVVAIVGLIAYAVLVEDPVTYWQPTAKLVIEFFQQLGWQKQADTLLADPELMARLLTLTTVLGLWMNYCLSLLLGYHLFQQLPDNTDHFGRFKDLNFGRVIASALVLMSLLSFFSGIELLENIAILLFAIFCVQGLALGHWLYAEKKLPLIALVAIYLLPLFLNILFAVLLAILGYLDAWFGFRRRIEKSKGSKT